MTIVVVLLGMMAGLAWLMPDDSAGEDEDFPPPDE